MTAYYNEIDPFAAAWLRQLISAGHIAPGDVDERSIVDVRPDDLRKYTQCHFFAGIGVWSYSLRQAGWSDDRPIWTGSCPCQPFSTAGKGGGFADERHLWPAFYHLIGECEPTIAFGEQVEGEDGLAWLDLVQVDLEELGYACGAVVTPAAGFGAPHGRHRQYWAAKRLSNADEIKRRRRADSERLQSNGPSLGRVESDRIPQPNMPISVLAHDDDARLERRSEPRSERTAEFSTGSNGMASVMEHADMPVTNRGRSSSRKQSVRNKRGDEISIVGTGPLNGFWGSADWLFCRDEFWRPVEPGTFPLAHGIAARMEQLRGYGNAITSAQATAFIEAYLETEADRCVRVEGAFA